MYRNAHITARKARYQGIGNQPPNQYGRDELRDMAFHDHIRGLVMELIQDEDEAIKKYQKLIDVMKRYPHNTELKDIVNYIKSQEVAHKAILQRLRL